MMIKFKTMENYIIEHNIALPRKSKFKPLKYPFDKMNIGDSFQFELKTPKTHQQVISAAVRYRLASGNEKKFKIRTINKTTGRIWRVI